MPGVTLGAGQGGALSVCQRRGGRGRRWSSGDGVVAEGLQIPELGGAASGVGFDVVPFDAGGAVTAGYGAHQPIVGPGASWGLGTGVDLEAAEPWTAPGRCGWTGGTGTTAHVDPTHGTVGVLLTQRMMTGAQEGPTDFWMALAASAPRQMR